MLLTARQIHRIFLTLIHSTLTRDIVLRGQDLSKQGCLFVLESRGLKILL